MPKKEVNLFSKDELATLNNFCKEEAKEDKKIYNISNNNGPTKKYNSYKRCKYDFQR